MCTEQPTHQLLHLVLLCNNFHAGSIQGNDPSAETDIPALQGKDPSAEAVIPVLQEKDHLFEADIPAL